MAKAAEKIPVYTVKQDSNMDWCVYADGKEVPGACFSTRRAAIQEMSRIKTGESNPAKDGLDSEKTNGA